MVIFNCFGAAYGGKQFKAKQLSDFIIPFGEEATKQRGQQQKAQTPDQQLGMLRYITAIFGGKVVKGNPNG